MRSRPGRPRKRAPKPPGQQPTDADVERFTKEGAGPGGANIFGFQCRDCNHYEQMIGGVQQKRAIDKKALTHKCNAEEPRKRRDLE